LQDIYLDGNIREYLGHLIGQTIADVTQHDPDEYETDGAFVDLLFQSGDSVRFYMGCDECGFSYGFADDPVGECDCPECQGEDPDDAPV
jgi:hypothetical protein